MDIGIRTAGDIRKYCFSVLSPMYGDQEAKSIIQILFEDLIGWSRARLHTDAHRVLADTDIIRFGAAIARLEMGCPVQYITGTADFNGLKITVTPSVLIPRPETAELATIIADHLRSHELPDFTLLDIGTGSGCIAVYLKTLLPGLKVYALDASEEALLVASSNALKYKADVEFFRYDILVQGGGGPAGQYNLIVSNPPYVTQKEKKSMMSNVTDFEPASALFVPDEDPLLFYKAIAEYARPRLFGAGLLFLEINEAFGDQTADLLRHSGFSAVVLKDFRGRDRFIKAELMISAKVAD